MPNGECVNNLLLSSWPPALLWPGPAAAKSSSAGVQKARRSGRRSWAPGLL